MKTDAKANNSNPIVCPLCLNVSDLKRKEDGDTLKKKERRKKWGMRKSRQKEKIDDEIPG